MVLWRRSEAPGEVDLGELNDGKRGWFREGGFYVYRWGRLTGYGRAFELLRVGDWGGLLRVRDVLFTNYGGCNLLLLTGVTREECGVIADCLRIYGWELEPVERFVVPTRLRLVKLTCPVRWFRGAGVVLASRREGVGPARVMRRYLVRYPGAPDVGLVRDAALEIFSNNCYFKLWVALYEPGYKPDLKLARRLVAGHVKGVDVNPSSVYSVIRGMYVPAFRPVSRLSRREARGPALRLSSSYSFSLGSAGHALFIGSTGTGKSLAACYLAWQLAERGVPVLIIDVTGQYAHALGGRGFRVYELGHDYALDLLRLPAEAITEIPVYLMGEGAWTTPFQRSVAERALVEVRREGGTLFDAFRRLVEMEWSSQLSREDRSAAGAAWRRLEPLARVRGLSGAALRPAATGMGLEYPCVVKLSRLPEWESIAASALALLYSVLYEAVRGGFRADGLVVLLDEAHRVFQFRPAREHVVSRMCAELRKYGVKVWLVTQSLAGLPRSVLANIHHLFAFRPEVSDAEWLARRLRLDRGYLGGVDPVDALLSLGVGECFAQHGPGRAARVRVEPPGWLVGEWESWRPEPPRSDLLFESPILIVEEARRRMREEAERRAREAERMISEAARRVAAGSPRERSLLEAIARRPELAARMYAAWRGLLEGDGELEGLGVLKWDAGAGGCRLTWLGERVLFALMAEVGEDSLRAAAQRSLRVAR